MFHGPGPGRPVGSKGNTNDIGLLRTARNLEITIRRLSLRARKIDPVKNHKESVALVEAIAKLTSQYIAIARALNKLPKRMPTDTDTPVEVGGECDMDSGDPDFYEEMKKGV